MSSSRITTAFPPIALVPSSCGRVRSIGGCHAAASKLAVPVAITNWLPSRVRITTYTRSPAMNSPEQPSTSLLRIATQCVRSVRPTPAWTTTTPRTKFLDKRLLRQRTKGCFWRASTMEAGLASAMRTRNVFAFPHRPGILLCRQSLCDLGRDRHQVAPSSCDFCMNYL